MNKLSLIGAALLIATPASAAPEAPTCEALHVVSPQTVQTEKLPRFATTQIVDLDFNVVFPTTFGGKHVVHVELFTPNGHIYQRLDVPVDDNGKKATRRALKGYPRPVNVRPLQPFVVDNRQAKVARVRLPVAGTSIVKNGMYGTWKARAIVDGAKQACAEAQFTLVNR